MIQESFVLDRAIEIAATTSRNRPTAGTRPVAAGRLGEFVAANSFA
jgi:hypothetical protein